MNGRHGTPKTLTEAIENALSEITSTDPPVVKCHVIRSHVRDFICQKFSYAYLTATPPQVQMLRRLFSVLTSEDQGIVDAALAYYMKRIELQIETKGTEHGRATDQTDKEQK